MPLAVHTTAIDVLVLNGDGEYLFPDRASVTDMVLVKGIGVLIVVVAISVLHW